MFRYFGSKSSTAKFVVDMALTDFSPVTVADAFGGIGNIGAEFRLRGCEVTTCDLLKVPNAFQCARIVSQEIPSFSTVCRELGVENATDILNILNTADRPSQWFIREYSEKRQFFTTENAYRIGAAWATLVRWNRQGLLSDMERKYAVASLLNSMDACANTAGTYYAYLKSWHRKALRPFTMKWFTSPSDHISGVALLGDSLQSLTGKSFDLLYLDPPYNNRDYSRYYHLPETLAGLSTKRIDPNSKAGQPLKRATEGVDIRNAMKLPYLLNMIEAVGWKRLVVQYALGAHIAMPDLQEALAKYGDLNVHQVSALGYRTTQGIRDEKHYVFIVDR